MTFDWKAAAAVMKPLYSEERLRRAEEQQREASEFLAGLRFLDPADAELCEPSGLIPPEPETLKDVSGPGDRGRRG